MREKLLKKQRRAARGGKRDPNSDTDGITSSEDEEAVQAKSRVRK